MRRSIVAFVAALAWIDGTRASTLPLGFTDTLVASVSSPTAMAFTPDGRMLVTTQAGSLRIVASDGTLLPTPAFQFAPSAICTQSERGLLGVAVHPNFGFNGYIYVYYTFNSSTAGCVNRVSRFTLPASNSISAVSEQVLLDNIPSPAGNHNGGDLHFGSDGLNLYVSVGDGGCSLTNPANCAEANNNARFLNQVSGKILRVRWDGIIDPANPYFSTPGSRRCTDPAGVPPGTGPCQEIFAHGLRNPFRIAFRKGTNFFHINDVGQGTWEEIDVGILGADYGWNVREGPCVTGSTTNCTHVPPYVDPVYAYTRGAGCASITGGAFVAPRQWPSTYRDQYLFADFVCGSIFSLALSGAASTFGSAFGSNTLTALTVGPSSFGRSLYYATYASGGQVRRIDYTGGPTFAKQDFEGNVRSDLVWRRNDGSIALWLMNGGSLAGTAGYVVASDWTLVGTGDFNGDGKADMLFRRSSDGYLLAWLMDGTTMTGLWGRVSSPVFQFGLVADVNGDGIDDIVLSGSGSAHVAISQSAYAPQEDWDYPLGPGWTLAGRGDINGDGTDDLVWRHSGGTVAIWFMNGGQIASIQLFALGTDWTLRAVADINGDGKADMVWRHTGGTIALWFMNGTGIVGTALYWQPTAWDIAGTADFNGDGRADIVWRHAGGSAAIWLMNGSSILGVAGLPQQAEWTAVGLQ